MIGQAALHEHEALVPSAYVVENPAERRTILTRLAKQYGAPPRPCRAFPGGHPTSLTRPDIARVRAETCFFSLKTDGVRYLLLLCDLGDEYKAFCIDRCLRIFEIVVWCNEDYFTKTTLLDGELVFDHARNRLCYQVFDVVTMRGRSCRAMQYSDRLQVLHDLLGEIPGGLDESSGLAEQYIADEDKLYCAHRTDVCMHMAPKRFVPLGGRAPAVARAPPTLPERRPHVHFDDYFVADAMRRPTEVEAEQRDRRAARHRRARGARRALPRGRARGGAAHARGRRRGVRGRRRGQPAAVPRARSSDACALVECLAELLGQRPRQLWPMRERTDKVEANDVRVIRSTLSRDPRGRGL